MKTAVAFSSAAALCISFVRMIASSGDVMDVFDVPLSPFVSTTILTAADGSSPI